MRAVRLPLRVVFYYEQDQWVAHCLEFDLVGDGESQVDALKCLTEAIELQIAASLEHNNAENLFSPAEGKFLRMFAQGKNIALGHVEIHIDGVEIDSVETRSYEFEESEPEPVAG